MSRKIVLVAIYFSIALTRFGLADSTPAAAAFAPLPEATSSFGAIVSENWLYMYGGHVTPTHIYSTESASGHFYRLNLTEGKTWEELPGGPKVQGMDLAAYQGSIYRAGGMQSLNAPKTKSENVSIADAARFDPADKTWHALPSLPEPRSSHEVVVVDNKLFAIGGWTMEGAKGEKWLTTMAMYDLNSPKPAWHNVKQPFKRRSLTATALNHKIYVIGGFGDDDEATLSVQVYDWRANTWAAGPDLPGPSGNGFAPASCTLSGALYVSVADGSVYRLDAAGKAWEKVGAGKPRIVHRIAGDHSHILVMGGAAKGEVVNLIESIDVHAPTVGDRLKPMVDQNIMAGATYLIADKNKVLEQGTLGYASLKNKTPMELNDLFWIASMTKPITSTALMMLVDEGKVSVSDPVEKYLPEFKGQLVDDGNGKPRPPTHPITIREILSHTSGMIKANDKRLKHNEDLKLDVAEYASFPLTVEPYTKYEYNNCGINTAGRIIEVVSGMKYADFMQKRLFDPLGMKDTTFWPTDEQVSRLAHSARPKADKSGLEEVELDKNVTPALAQKLSNGVHAPEALVRDMGMNIYRDYGNHYAMPAGGLYSTAPDLARFCQMLLNGGTFEGKRYISEAALKEMTSDHTGPTMPGTQECYGLGWSVKKGSEEGPLPGSFGHRGARRTIMWVDPRSQLVMILLLERFEMAGEEGQKLYNTFGAASEERYGTAK